MVEEIGKHETTRRPFVVPARDGLQEIVEAPLGQDMIVVGRVWIRPEALRPVVVAHQEPQRVAHVAPQEEALHRGTGDGHQAHGAGQVVPGVANHDVGEVDVLQRAGEAGGVRSAGLGHVNVPDKRLSAAPNPSQGALPVGVQIQVPLENSQVGKSAASGRKKRVVNKPFRHSQPSVHLGCHCLLFRRRSAAPRFRFPDRKETRSISGILSLSRVSVKACSYLGNLAKTGIGRTNELFG